MQMAFVHHEFHRYAIEIWLPCKKIPYKIGIATEPYFDGSGECARLPCIGLKMLFRNIGTVCRDSHVFRDVPTNDQHF